MSETLDFPPLCPLLALGLPEPSAQGLASSSGLLLIPLWALADVRVTCREEEHLRAEVRAQPPPRDLGLGEIAAHFAIAFPRTLVASAPRHLLLSWL